MKINVNGNCYEIEIIGNKTTVNGKEIKLTPNENEIIIDGKQFFLDFFEEGEPSLMIINGISYLVSKNASESTSVKELKAPINGQIVDVFVKEGKDVVKGQLLIILEAMKMENQMKSPVKGRIKKVRVKKGQLVKSGEVLVTFG
jgi:biotin carboxyl carrier protein